MKRCAVVQGRGHEQLRALAELLEQRRRASRGCRGAPKNSASAPEDETDAALGRRSRHCQTRRPAHPADRICDRLAVVGAVVGDEQLLDPQRLHLLHLSARLCRGGGRDAGERVAISAVLLVVVLRRARNHRCLRRERDRRVGGAHLEQFLILGDPHRVRRRARLDLPQVGDRAGVVDRGSGVIGRPMGELAEPDRERSDLRAGLLQRELLSIEQILGLRGRNAARHARVDRERAARDGDRRVARAPAAGRAHRGERRAHKSDRERDPRPHSRFSPTITSRRLLPSPRQERQQVADADGGHHHPGRDQDPVEALDVQ